MAAHWTDGLDDAAIRAVVGPATFDRGADYARRGQVLRVSGRGGGALLGEVRGSGREPYATLVTPAPPGSRSRREWTARCSCPVGEDCKHAVAVLLSARGSSAPEGDDGADDRADDRPAWEARLGALVRRDPEPERSAGPPLALQLEVVRTPPGLVRRPSAAAELPERRVLLRPLVRGARGTWIRGGASWRELDHGWAAYGRAAPDAAHREALLALHAAWEARGRGRYLAERPVHLDEVGPAVWALLRRARGAGVTLLAGEDGEVRLAERPARGLVDVVQGGDAARAGRGGRGSASMTAVVDVDGRQVPASDVLVVGSPAHGVVVEEPDGALLLAGLAEPAGPQLSTLLLDGRRVEIPAADLPRFLREYYPRLRQVLELVSSDGSVTFPEVSPPGLALRLEYGGGRGRAHDLALAWQLAYPVGDEVVRVPLTHPDDEDGAAEDAVRDPAAERALLDGLAAAAGGHEVLWEDGEDGGRRLAPRRRLGGLDTVRFTEDVLPVLREAGVAVEVHGEPGEYRYTDEAPVVRLSTTESADRDWFDLGVTVTVGDEQVPFEPLFVALAHGESHLVLDSGTWFAIDRPELEQLRTLIEEARELQDRPGDGLRISAYQADLWEELARLGVVEQQSRRWAEAVGALSGLEELPEWPVPAGVRAELRPYQLDGYRWLAFLAEHGLGGVLADDMGLGKTLQVLAMVAGAVERGTSAPFLVVAPTSVVPTWLHEAERFTPDLRVVAVTQTSRASGRSVAEQADGAHVVVTSYALFRLDGEQHGSLPWAGLLLDEAQAVKNHRGRTHQVARRVDAPFKLAVTGTPLENNLMELWALLSVVAPGLYPDPKRFAARWATPIEKGDREQLARLRRRVRPLLRRRTKEQVATELPPKVEQVIEVELNPRHRRVYATHLQRERQKVLRLIDDPQRNRFAILRSITLLRRLSLDPALVDEAYAGVPASKVDVLAELLQEVVGEGHRALVFSQFTGFLATVRARLEADGVAYSYLDGRTRDRARRLQEFRDGDQPVFLISLKAGGVGLTLTEADYVFVLDPWWNPAVEAQAVDRTHRIGQDKTVMVYRLVASDTIEDKVMQLKARKLELFASVIDDGDALGGALTAEEIAGLLED
ncbi:DEAD/DEAH box helicase [Aquipuribacter sp. SD81]|uniref:DEAD/DEAH box helicase n=1 Tax=Aquipuribacter sp. SD81 TaxID=3127703 RepID=UPI00301A1A00